jgi:NitT/TauT family transport system ATP-binding protein
MSDNFDGTIDLADVSYSYADLPVLQHVNAHLDSGKIVSIVGPSGCGKTTLLNIIAGIRKPTAGGVKVSGTISYMFQHDVILPWFKVERNAGMGLIFADVPKAERKERVHELLRKVGLEEFSNLYPHQLSGGMRRRLQMVTIIATDPEIILMDEPFIALDELTKMEMHDVFLQVWSTSAEVKKKTVVLVTHDISEAVSLSDEVYVMTRRPSTVKQIVKVDLPRPRNVFTIRTNDDYLQAYRDVYRVLSSEL